MNSPKGKPKRNKGKRQGFGPKTNRNDSYGEERESKAVRDTERNNTFGGNSIEWFSRYPNLLMAAGSVPYPYKPGMEVPLGYAVEDPSASTDYELFEYPIPGIITIDWFPTLGTSNSPTSPISIVGKEVYAKVREKFSGNLDADAPDFVVYFVCLDSIFSYIASLKRIYRTLNAYSPENLFTPDGILRALGFNDYAVDFLRSRKMELFQRINELILMTRKFKCPRIMDLFNRHVWLNDHIYTDAPSIKAQFYAFNQKFWYYFAMVPVPGSTPQVSAGGAYTKFFSPPSSGDVIDYLYKFGRDMIDALASSDDGYLISGYLMRAYEGYPEFTVDELLLGEELVPKYNEEVLGEIENSHSIPGGYTTIDCYVAQDPSTNAIITNPTITYPADSDVVTHQLYGVFPRFSSRNDVPTVAETTINSRLMTYLGERTTQGEYKFEAICCTELVINYKMTYVRFNKSHAPTWYGHAYSSELVCDITASTERKELLDLTVMMQSSQWDWCPLLWVFIVSNTGYRFNTIIGDTHNFTTTTDETLRNINTVCLYSLFGTFN